jgi:hypothetical protein
VRVNRKAERVVTEALTPSVPARANLDALIARTRRLFSHITDSTPLAMGTELARVRVRDTTLLAQFWRPATMPARVDISTAELEALSWQGERMPEESRQVLAAIGARYGLDWRATLTAIGDVYQRKALYVEGELWE